ncbi:hypothetical protein SAMN05216391_11198, partial [Lachnospiraceae bacterium KHCPX20]
MILYHGSNVDIQNISLSAPILWSEHYVVFT